MRGIGRFLLAKNINAAVVAFICTLMPLIHLPGAFLAAIIVGLVTLSRGYLSGLIVLAWVALPAVSLLILGRFGGFDVLLLRCALVWVFAGLLRQYGSWRFVLEIAAILGVIAVIVLHISIPDVGQWWATHIMTYLKEVSKAADLKLSAADTKLILERFVPIASGAVCFFMLLGSVLQLILARWWQSVLFNPGGLRQEFLAIRMSRAAALVLFAIILGAFFHVSMLIDLLPVLMMPFMLAGLSLLHKLADNVKLLLIPLILLYVGILFLPYLIIGLLAVVGYADSWIDFRKRLIPCV